MKLYKWEKERTSAEYCIRLFIPLEILSIWRNEKTDSQSEPLSRLDDSYTRTYIVFHEQNHLAAP